MNFIYRNILSETVRFTLGSEKYEVLPGSTVEVPEKYDYAIEEMGVRLEKDYEQSIFNDQLSNPERWNDFIASQANVSDGYGSENSVSENKVKDAAPKHPRAMRARKK